MRTTSVAPSRTRARTDDALLKSSVPMRLLGQQAEARAASQVHAPRVRLQPARGDLEERRLASTIGTHEAHTLAAREGGRHGCQDDEVADLAAHALETQDGHAASVHDSAAPA